MGLDNIPKQYPCEMTGTAVKTDNRIDCDATINCGKCPWKNEFETDPMLKGSKPTYGMFGTPCWYRGKYGNGLLSLLEHGEFNAYADTTYSFYGDSDDGMSREYCEEMHLYMRDNTEKFAFQAQKSEPENYQEYVKDWLYATWWVKFVANFADGSNVWH
jgi:hypothetical protein